MIKGDCLCSPDAKRHLERRPVEVQRHGNGFRSIDDLSARAVIFEQTPRPTIAQNCEMKHPRKKPTLSGCYEQ